MITRLALANVVDVTRLDSEQANPRANFDRKLLDALGIRKVKGIWLKRDKDPLESSSKPKRLKTRAQKKTLPPRKARQLTTIKESSLTKSLDKESRSTKEPVPQTCVNLEYSDEEEVPLKECSPDHLALSLSFEVEEERPTPAQSPVMSPDMSLKIPQHAPANPTTTAFYLDEVLQASEARYRKILREERDAILAPILKKPD